jgi:molybdopterin converting factor small subunit
MKVMLNFGGIPVLYKALNKRKELEFDFPGRTLRELVQNLVRKFGPPITKALLDGNGDVDVEIRVVLNDGTYLTERRMETVLNEGDMVAFRGAS